MAYVFPTIKVDAAFGYQALAASPAFTDLSADIRSVDINRGRSSLLDHFQAGKATIILNNRSRQYDPLYAAGAYYGQLKSDVRVRIRATLGATTYALFEGFVDNWSQPYTIGNDLVCQLSCTDGFKIFARSPLTGSSFAQATMAQRVTDVANAVGWPSTRLNATAGSVMRAMSSDELTDVSALAHLQAVDDTEWGQMYVGRDGSLTALNRTQLVTSAQFTTPQVTFGDSGTSTEIPYQAITIDHSDDLVRNWIDVTNPTFDPTTNNVESFTDAASYADHGWKKHSFTTLDPTPEAARNTGLNVLSLFKDQHPTLPPITVKLHRRDLAWPDGLFAAVLGGTGLGWRVNMKRRPLQIGAPISVDCWINSMSHQIRASNRSWTAMFGLGYARPSQSYATWDAGSWDTDEWGW